VFTPMVRDSDGSFYGTTFQGGYDAGIIFKLCFGSTARPAIENVTETGGQTTLTGSAVPGRSYQLQSTADLNPPIWTALGTDLTATGTVFSVTDTLPQSAQKFYRFKLELP
jgi:hypothetical protein